VNQGRFDFLDRAIFTAEEPLDTNKAWTMKVQVINTAKPMSPASRSRKSLAFIGLLLAVPALLWSQSSLLQDGEIAVASGVAGDQMRPAVSFNALGGYAVWQDNATDPSGLGVSAVRLDAGLSPIGAPFRINETLTFDQQRPAVAVFSDGRALVTWQSGKSSAQRLFARILTADGAPATGQFIVNPLTIHSVRHFTTNWTLIRNNRPRTRSYRIREKVTGREEFNPTPAAVVLTDGTAVVAYSSTHNYWTNTYGLRERLSLSGERIVTNRSRVHVTTSPPLQQMQDVYFQRFSATGEKLGAEVRANQFTPFHQRDAALAALDNGNFVVAWVSEQQRINGSDEFVNPVDVFARVFDVSGNPLGNELRVNTTNRVCGSPSVAGSAGGGFMVAWSQRATERTNGMDVVARAFDASGTATTDDPFEVNNVTYGDQFAPSVANVGSQQLIIWNSMGQDGSWEGVYGRPFNGSVALTSEFRINVTTRYSQKHPRVASDSSGRAMVIWSSYAVDSGFDVFGRVYGAP
jgi:hypothetical protein